MTGHLPEIGSTVTRGRSQFTVERHGCATGWAECPHGERALTVRRLKGSSWTECLDASGCSWDGVG